MEEWIEQLQNSVNTLDRLKEFINVAPEEAVSLKGINNDFDSFTKLRQKLLAVRIRPYNVFYCEPAPGIDHFRTPVEKGAELIRYALPGHTTGLAQPMCVITTNIGKIPSMPDYYFLDKNVKKYTLRNYKGEITTLPNTPDLALSLRDKYAL